MGKIPHDIGFTEQADQVVFRVKDHDAGYFFSEHDKCGFFQSVVQVHGDAFVGHHILDLHLRQQVVHLMDVHVRGGGWRSLFQVMVSDNTGKLSLRENRQASDVVFLHDPGGTHHGSVGVNSQHGRCHPVFYQHENLLE